MPHLARNLSISAMDAPRFAQANGVTSRRSKSTTRDTGSFSYHRFFVVNFLDAAIVEVHFEFVVSDLHCQLNRSMQHHLIS